MRPVVIIGAHGQDGRLLCDKLQQQGKPTIGFGRSDFDPLDRPAIERVVAEQRPAEVYYLAAHHHSAEDSQGNDDASLFKSSFDIHVGGLVHLLEAIRARSPETRVFYAASSHIFGQPKEPVQNEMTATAPRCIYGITKTAGLHCCRYYRDTHGLFASVGILYNHESQYRQRKFVSQKIIQGGIGIASNKQAGLQLGSLAAKVDWGYAPDYVEAMQRILALPFSDDFVIGTGESHSIQEFVEVTFTALGLDWRKYVTEKPGIITKQRHYSLVGDYSKLHAATGWQPSLSFGQMVELLIQLQLHGA